MKVGIIGTGAIGLGSVALLLSFNHKPILWSPSGKGTHPFEKNKQLIALGKVEGTFNPSVVKSAKELVLSSDIIKFAVPAHAHKDVIDAIFPFIETRQVIALSSYASFTAVLNIRTASAPLDGMAKTKPGISLNIVKELSL